PFFDPRPILFTPLFDGCFIALAGSSLQVLLCEPQSMKQSTGVVGMILNAELLKNDFARAAASPQFGRKAGGSGPGADNLLQLLFLSQRELERPSPVGFGPQDCQAACGDRTFPTLDARQVSSDQLSDLRVTPVIL